MIIPQNILLCRTNNIGDVILAIPMVDAIKTKWPACRVTLLLRQYTAELAAFFPQVDDVIVYDRLAAMPPGAAVASLRAKNFDVCIHVHDDKQVAELVKRARIPWRIGTAHRLFHWLTCNKLVFFSRSRSDLHDAALNLKLLRPLGISVETDSAKLIPKIKVCARDDALFPDFLDSQDRRFRLILHPGSNGNGREWPPAYFTRLIGLLDPERFKIFITGSAAEKQKFAGMIHTDLPHVCDIRGQFSLTRLIQFLMQADGMVAAGTGPIHLAAAIGIRTLGLFPPLKTGNPRRWRPLGRQAEYLVKPGQCDNHERCVNTDCTCMRAISPENVAEVLQRWHTAHANQVSRH